MTTTTELKKLLFSMILKTPIWLVHLAANQSSVMSIPSYIYDFMIDSLITVIYFCYVTPPSDWDAHSPNFQQEVQTSLI